MTMPHLMNCEHQDYGWCLECVKKLQAKNDKLVKACEMALADYRATYIIGETTSQKTVDRNGRIAKLCAALEGA